MKSAKIKPTARSKPIHVVVLLLPDSGMLSLAATIDPLRAANRLSGRAVYSWEIRSVSGNDVLLTSGIRLPAEPAIPNMEADILAIVAGFNLKAHSSASLQYLIRSLALRVPLVCAIDGGGEILARTGLLDGHRATTHWEDLEDLALAFPDITVVRDRFIQSGKFITTGGASPCIDMMLHLIAGHYGRGLSESVMRAFLYDPVHAGSDPQTLVSVSRLQKRSPKVARAILLMEQRIEEPLSVAEIARESGLSVRRLEMLFRDEFGVGPGRYFRQLRLQEAWRMVLETPRALQEIALRCGFNSQSAFTRAFSDQFGLTPSRLRAGERP